ncbi:MAG: class I SAM-dependent methyltransferase [Kiritimatiellae bacterium]|nr:class I SAM-dependent methyltransferase [Kiritimatiellia bacterium]
MKTKISPFIKIVVKTLLGMNVRAVIYMFSLKPGAFFHACMNSYKAANEGNIAGGNDIPEIELYDILGNRKPLIQIPVRRYEEGQLSTGELMVLLSILVAESPGEVLEIGTYMGYTTRLMAENLKTGIIHSVDLPKEYSAEHDPEPALLKDDYHLIDRRIVGKEYIDHPCAHRIVQHYADTASWDFREAGHPAFFFIDGSHTYEYCKNDTEKCIAFAGKQCVILWHDCNELHPGVLKYLNECRTQGLDIRRISGTSIAYLKIS